MEKKDAFKAKGQRIPFVVRQATSVAYAVAEKIQGFRPTLLNQPFIYDEGAKDKETIVCFRFEGGLCINVNLYDMSRLVESWRHNVTQEWVATGCDYAINRNGALVDLDMIDYFRLLEIKNRFHWHHPRVMNRDEITGQIGVFWDGAAHEGHTEVDPEYSQSGYRTMADSVPYMILVEGELEKAREEAEKILASHYTAHEE